jgi:sec-independent protein translocase protein TatB
MDFGFSGEMVFLALLALILFGPRRLPEIARQVGRFMAEFRRASNEFQNQIHDEVRKLEMDEATKALSAGGGEILPASQPNSIANALDRLTDRIKSFSSQD